MRKLMAVTFVSLDGVAQGPGGPDEDREGGFEHGGWAAPFIDDELIGVMRVTVERAGALLLGRRTYEEFAATWPLADDPIGARMNGLPKHVASRTLGRADWRNTTLLEGDAATAVPRLKAGDGGEIQVHGSLGLIRSLLAHGLVDAFQLMICPVLVGSGKRLFGDGTVPATLRPVRTEMTGRGVLVAEYAGAGALEHGAVGPETGNW